MALPRTLEPEVMDTPEEALDYDQMDHREVNRLFVSDLLAWQPVQGKVLDLGTGTAQIPIELCRQTETCRVLAIDLSTHMLELARYNVEIAGLIERIQLAHVDGKVLPYGDATFDAVISNSIVHHIPQPQTVLAEALRVTVPGGLIFFRDLLRPPDEAAVLRLVQTYAVQTNERQQRMFADSLRAALTLDEMQRLVEPLGLPPSSVTATSDRHWTWKATRP